MQKFIAPVFEDGFEAVWLEEFFDVFCIAFEIGYVLGRDPLYSRRLLLLILHLGLVLTEKELGGLLKQDIVVTLPCCIDVD